MPHELLFDPAGHMYIAERDNHVVRRVDRATGLLSTVAGSGVAGFSGDGGPASKAQLRQPHSIALGADNRLLICDVGNHRIRAVDLSTGGIDTIGGTGERFATPDGAPLKGTPLNGPRTMVIGPDGTAYLALREGNALYRIAPRTGTVHHLAGTGEQGYRVTADLPASPGSRDRRVWPYRDGISTWPIPRIMRFGRSTSGPASSRQSSGLVRAAMDRRAILCNASSPARTDCSPTGATRSMYPTANHTAFGF